VLGARERAWQSKVAEDARVAEEGDRLCALVLERVRRHCHPGLIGEQGDEGLRVSAFDRFREAADELAFLRRVRDWWRRVSTTEPGALRALGE